MARVTVKSFEERIKTQENLLDMIRSSEYHAKREVENLRKENEELRLSNSILQGHKETLMHAGVLFRGQVLNLQKTNRFLEKNQNGDNLALAG